jgi:hypothetical protein
MKTSSFVSLMSFLAMLLTSHVTRAAVVTWEASSGLYPDQISPPYTLFDTAAADPVLSGGVLTLTSSTGALDLLGYDHSGAILDVPPNLQIEAAVRFVSGSSATPNRAPIGIQFVTAPGATNFLFIEADTIFTNNPGDVRGPSAPLDTDDAFHTYRIEVVGTGVGSPFNVFYDNGALPVLTGALINSGVGAPFIDWGDLSDSTGGVSEWQRFQHNAAAAIPEASSLAMLIVAAIIAAGRTLKRFACGDVVSCGTMRMPPGRLSDFASGANREIAPFFPCRRGLLSAGQK